MGCLTTQIALERVVSEECTMYSICSLRSQEAPYTSHLAQTTYASRHIPPQTIRLSLSGPINDLLLPSDDLFPNYRLGCLTIIRENWDTFSSVPLHILWLMIAQCVPHRPQSGRWCLWISASLHSVVSLHDLTEWVCLFVIFGPPFHIHSCRTLFAPRWIKGSLHNYTLPLWSFR